MLKKTHLLQIKKHECLSKEMRILEVKWSTSLPLTFADELSVITCSKSSENNAQTESMPILIQT